MTQWELVGQWNQTALKQPLEYQLAKVKLYTTSICSGAVEQRGAGGHPCHLWAHVLPVDIYSRSSGDEQDSAAKTTHGHRTVPPLPSWPSCCTALTHGQNSQCYTTVRESMPAETGAASPVTTKNRQEKTALARKQRVLMLFGFFSSGSHTC